MVARVVVVTGRPGIGKTTAVLRICDLLRERGVRVGGFITSEKRTAEGRRTGFEIHDLSTGERRLMASEAFRGGPRVGRYFVDLGFEDLALSAIDRSLKECDVTVVDEIGPMELLGGRLVEKLQLILPSGYPVLATVHYMVRHRLISEALRLAGPHRYVLDLSNRDRVPLLIAEVVMGWLGQS
ncbi:Nucleoside-triphosphatase THEP1 [archaeon HR01]|nr:Nucleoside-triphosphatase THEP1 [archaeon HR01]